jgi:hypothetical protein
LPALFLSFSPGGKIIPKTTEIQGSENKKPGNDCLPAARVSNISRVHHKISFHKKFEHNAIAAHSRNLHGDR